MILERRGWFVLAVAGATTIGASFALGRKIGFVEGRNSLPVLRSYPSVEQVGDWRGRVDICLQTAKPEEPGHTINGQIAQTIEGTVVGLGSARAVRPLAGHALFCEIDPEWYVDIADAAKSVSRILYAASGTTIGSPNLRVGAQVTVRMRARWGFGKAAGVIVSDESGPVLIAEQGAFGHGLHPEDLEPIAVGVGDAIGVRHEGCGDAVVHALDVRGDRTTRVLPGRIGSLTLRGASYRFWNAASYAWINIGCTDMLDQTSWLLWRE
jgi:hypothetical protein